MNFKTFQVIINQQIPLDSDMIKVTQTGKPFVKEYYQDWYQVDREFIENRFLWVYCQYNNAKLYNRFIWDGEEQQRKINPRTKSQVELYKQLFFCYDCREHILYTNNMEKRGFLQYYLHDALQKEVIIKNIYTSLEEFQKSIKYIKGLKFVQERRVQNEINGSIFRQQANLLGLDVPEKLTMQVEYVRTPIGNAKNAIQNFKKWRDQGQFESIILVGEDDSGIEQNFDFSSIIQSIQIEINKDENNRYDSEKIKELLLHEIR